MMIVSAPRRIITDGLGLWLRGDIGVYNTGSTEATNGQTVETWDDQGPNGWNFAQATAGRRPIARTDVLSGHRVVRFDGSDDTLEVGSTALARNVAGATMMAFTNWRSVPATGKRIFYVSNGAAVAQPRIGLDGGVTANKARVQGRSTDGGGVLGVDSSSDIATGFRLYTGVVRFTAAEVDSYIGATLEGTGSGTMDAAVSSDTDSLRSRLAANGAATPGQIADIDIAEILVWHRALSTAELQFMRRYFLRKYGVI